MSPSAEIISSIKIAKLPKKKLKLIRGCPITKESLFQPTLSSHLMFALRPV